MLKNNLAKISTLLFGATLLVASVAMANPNRAVISERLNCSVTNADANHSIESVTLFKLRGNNKFTIMDIAYEGGGFTILNSSSGLSNRGSHQATTTMFEHENDFFFRNYRVNLISKSVESEQDRIDRAARRRVMGYSGLEGKLIIPRIEGDVLIQCEPAQFN